MNTPCETPVQSDRLTAFWDRMAFRYPLPFAPKTLTDTRRVLAMAKDRGVDITRASILDVGCGTGIYSLPMALEANRVTALDDSESMLRRMADAMAAEGINNVRTLRTSWKDIDVAALGFEKAFDLVWTSMTPAVQTLEDFEAMEQCAARWCVYIGWGGKRENRLIEEIYRLHGLHLGPPPGVRAARDILVKAGRSPSLDYFETSWTWTGPVEEAREDMACFIEMQGAKPDLDLISEVLDRHVSDGLIRHTTDVEEGLMVWQVEQSHGG